MSDIIDNSKLIPPYTDDQHTIMENGSPDWIKSLIMAECRLATATPEGTIKSAVMVLDHYSEMGVNGLWVTPVHDRGPKGNGYGNWGPHTIDPGLTGTSDYNEGWKIFKEFVDEAHKRNIRIFLDIISWGIEFDAPLFQEHPDWFEGTLWGGAAFNWKNEELKEWYISEVVKIGMRTGVDAFRYDVEPQYAGYDVDLEIRKRLEANGRRMAMMSELSNERRGVYDLEQGGVNYAPLSTGALNPENLFTDMYNIVDCVKTGTHIGPLAEQKAGTSGCYRYYTNCLSCHDFKQKAINGNRIIMGYSGIFAPFIPLWYIGEEWNNEKTDIISNVHYFSDIHWQMIDWVEHRNFYEDVKKMIRLRRQYSQIFEYFPDNHREVNICRVLTTESRLQAYARYFEDTAIIIVPNHNLQNESHEFFVFLPLTDMKMQNYNSITISDAYTGDIIAKGTPKDLLTVKVDVPYEDLRVLVVKGK